jgi:hypothetical protein
VLPARSAPGLNAKTPQIVPIAGFFIGNASCQNYSATASVLVFETKRARKIPSS